MSSFYNPCNHSPRESGLTAHIDRPDAIAQNEVTEGLHPGAPEGIGWSYLQIGARPGAHTGKFHNPYGLRFFNDDV
jgi:hypothetical protein